MKAQDSCRPVLALNVANGGRRGPHETNREHSEALFSYPCPLDVRKMPRRAAGFGCSQCHKSVVDTSEMTMEEAAALIRNSRSDLCVSYSVVEDGRIAFRSTGRGRLAIGLATFLAACSTPNAPGENPEPTSHDVPPTSDVPATPLEEDDDSGEKFEQVHQPVSLSAPVVSAPKDSWPSANCDSSPPQADGKRHLPIAGSTPPNPNPSHGAVALPGGIRPPDTQPNDVPVPPRPPLAGKPAPPPTDAP